MFCSCFIIQLSSVGVCACFSSSCLWFHNFHSSKVETLHHVQTSFMLFFPQPALNFHFKGILSNPLRVCFKHIHKSPAHIWSPARRLQHIAVVKYLSRLVKPFVAIRVWREDIHGERIWLYLIGWSNLYSSSARLLMILEENEIMDD